MAASATAGSRRRIVRRGEDRGSRHRLRANLPILHQYLHTNRRYTIHDDEEPGRTGRKDGRVGREPGQREVSRRRPM